MRGVHVIPSQFDLLLNSLPLAPNPRILDVGAGGFVGETTTKHLIKIPGARVDGIELDKHQVDALAEKFGDQMRAMHGDFLTHEFDTTYDLIVLDMPSQTLPAEFESWIPGKVTQLLNPNGIVIALCYGFGPAEPHEHWQFADEMRLFARDFLLRFFGVDVLTEAAVAARYDRDPLYRFLGMRGKQGYKRAETVVWIALQRR